MSKHPLESQRHGLTTSRLSKSWTLWGAWVAATAIAEMIGFVWVCKIVCVKGQNKI